MARQINAFPILGLNKSRRRIRLITMKYQMDALLPADFDTMNLDAVRRIPCFKIANPKTVAAECRFDPYQPEEVKKGEELRYLMYSTDDELFGMEAATAKATSRKPRKRPIMLPSDNGSESDEVVSPIDLKITNHMDNIETQYKPKRNRSNKYRKVTLDQREMSSAELVTRLEKIGCSVESIQAPRDVLVKSKLRCYVDDCAVLSREAGLGNPRRNFLTTLPTNIETALQWICLCLNNVARQNHWILKLIAHIQELRSDNSEPFCSRLTTAERIKAFPFRICDRHFQKFSNSIEEEVSTASESTSELISPAFYLPTRKIASDPNTDNLLLRRRSHYRSWCLSVQDAIGVKTTTSLPREGVVCEKHFVGGELYLNGKLQSSKADLQYWIPSLKLNPSGISSDCWIQRLKDVQYSAPPSKKRCCIETDAIRTKLARIRDKSSLLYNLILRLYECYGLEVSKCSAMFSVNKIINLYELVKL
uniref:THAP-type domain-containing protein n=1 Tax=Heterorhabditis bacteriophora TaxID=37862 RepID=A0A1I7XMQ5_HETBA